MYLLIIQLFKQEYKEDIFLAFTSCGIKKASFFEGYNLDKVLQEDFSLFKGIIKSKEEKERFSILITGIVDNKETANEFLQILKDSGIDLNNEDILRLILLPAIMIKDKNTEWEG